MSTFRRGVLAVGASAAAAACLLLSSGASDARAACVQVSGHYDEHPVTGPDCASPVGLCIAGTYRGGISGPFEGWASAVVATADTPTTGVQQFTSNSTIMAGVDGRRGVLIIKNAGSFSTLDGGPIVDLQTITGGTGELNGAHGSLRAEGTFTFPSGGRSTYHGIVCMP